MLAGERTQRLVWGTGGQASPTLPGLQSSFSLICGREAALGLLPSTLLPACRRLKTACPEGQVTDSLSVLCPNS